MKNRIPKYAGRIKLTQVSGNTYDMELADEPIQEGTPLTKENLLSDETAENLGLTSEDPTVDEALAALADANTVTFENYNDGNYITTGIKATDYGLCDTDSSGGTNAEHAQVGSYAIFRTYSSSSYTSHYLVFDESMTKTIVMPYYSSYTINAVECGDSAVGDYALFPVTYWIDSETRTLATPLVETIDKSLTKGVTSSGFSNTRYDASAASNDNYVFFAGGVNGAITSTYTTVNAYNSSLTRSTPTALPTATYGASHASTPNYAFFGMGSTTASSSTAFMVAYDTSATRTTLTASGTGMEGALAGDYVIFEVTGTTAYVYDTSLTYHGTITLPYSSYLSSIASLGDYAIMANNRWGYSAIVIDNTLTISTADAFTDPVRYWGVGLTYATDDVERAMFFGGQSEDDGQGGYFGIYTLEDPEEITTYDISVPPMSEYSFSDGSEGFATEETTVSGEGTVSGYIKRGNITV